MLKTHRFIHRAAIVIAIAAMPGVAKADPGEEEARSLFDAGVSAVEKGDFAAGCPKLVASLKLAMRAGTLLNLAQCDEHDGHLVSARDEWTRGIALLPANDPRLAISQDRLAKLEQRLPKLTVEIGRDAPPDARLAIDGVEIVHARLSSPLVLDPGQHNVVLWAAGHAERRVGVTLVEGDLKTVILSVGATSSSPVAPTPAPRSAMPENAAATSHTTLRTAGFVIGGVGLVGAIAAGVTSGMLASRNGQIKDACPDPSHCNQSGLDLINGGKPLMVVNAFAWGLGVAGLGAGAFLLVTNPRVPEARIVIAPTASAGGAGLAAAGRF